MCILRDNVASAIGGGAHLEYSDFTGCIIEGNRADTAGWVWLSSDWSSLDNCTITGNSANAGAGLSFEFRSRVATIVNTIIWGNLREQIDAGTGYFDISYSLIEGGWPGTGNFDGHPRFFSERGFDYLLGPGSPAIDAGDPVLADQIYDSHPWWPPWFENGVRSDIGAYGGPDNGAWLERTEAGGLNGAGRSSGRCAALPPRP